MYTFAPPPPPPLFVVSELQLIEVFRDLACAPPLKGCVEWSERFTKTWFDISGDLSCKICKSKEVFCPYERLPEHALTSQRYDFAK